MTSTDSFTQAPPRRRDLAAEIAAARQDLHARYHIPKAEVRVVVSPYRICPLGAHSDHQGGTVLGMAISAYTVLAFAYRADGEVRVHSAPVSPETGSPQTGSPQTGSSQTGSPQTGVTVAFPLRDPGSPRSGHWGSYVRGCAWVLRDLLPAEGGRGMVASVRGTLPGAGLSSSASVDLAYLTALARVNDIALSPWQLAVRAMRVETEYLGLGCGLLDPASIVGSRRHHLLRIDCRHESWKPVPPAPGMPPYSILVAFSGTTRQLAATGFNDRVAECRRAAAQVGAWVGRPGTSRLGELPLATVEAHLDRLPEAEGRRARHFTSEARRVEGGLAAWSRGDLETFGALMDESCQSSIRNYECGSPEIVDLYEILRSEPGVLGNRFSGGGYGGCCIALVEPGAVHRVQASAQARYLDSYPELGARARFFEVLSEDGVGVV